MTNRRDFLRGAALTGAAAALPGLSGCALGSRPNGHVVVVGGGYGGATVAKYLRMWSGRNVAVTLIERNPQFISCPMSNLVIGGEKTLADITLSYDGLKNTWGVQVMQDEVTAIDSTARSVRLASGGTLRYDRLVLSPGIEFMFDQVPGLESEAARSAILHARSAVRVRAIPCDRDRQTAVGVARRYVNPFPAVDVCVVESPAAIGPVHRVACPVARSADHREHGAIDRGEHVPVTLRDGRDGSRIAVRHHHAERVRRCGGEHKRSVATDLDG